VVNRASFIALLLCISTGAHSGKINLGEVFMRSNIGQCVELQFEGFSVFTKVTPSLLTGVSIRIIASPITSHYNPDFIVNVYPRLGTSPSLESFVVFGQVQNILSEPVVELLSGFDVPVAYRSYDEYAGVGSESSDDARRTTLRYFETEVLGHPGNIYTAVSRGMNGELPINVDNIADVVLEIPRQLASAPGVMVQSVRQLASGARNLGTAFPDLQGEGFDPVAWGQDLFSEGLADLYSLLPTDLLDRIQDIGSDSTTDVGSILTGALDKAKNINLGEEIADAAGSIIPNSCDPETDPDCDSALDQIMSLDLSGLPDYVGGELDEYFGNMSPTEMLGLIAPGMAEQLEQITSLVENYQAFGDMMDIISGSDALGGIGARFEQWKGMCPSDSNPMVPYWLSGMNVPGWRFKIPELVYPQTYVPFSSATTVGNFHPAALVGLGKAEGTQHNYGAVYPRNGYMMQGDSVKAGALAAFRAAHIATRDNQPYLYTYAEPKKNDDKFYMFDSSYEDFDSGSGRRSKASVALMPNEPETGRWQLIHAEGADLDKSCQIFGDPEVNPPVPELDGDSIATLIAESLPLPAGLLPDNKMPKQWTEGKQSVDHQYVYNLWRRYRCAPDPDTGSSWTTHNFNIIVPTITVVE